MLDDEHVDLDACHSRLKRLNRQRWLLEASTKPKLRTFLEINDENEMRSLVKCNLPRNQRSLLSKLKMGVLPLQIELGRWKDVPLEYRVCRVCEKDELEDEYHHVLFCDALVMTRTYLFRELKNVDYSSKENLLKSIFKPENLKTTGRYIEQMYMERRDLLYKSRVVEWTESDQ